MGLLVGLVALLAVAFGGAKPLPQGVNTAPLDPGLDPTSRAKLQALLADPSVPAPVLLSAASAADAAGFPQAARALRQKASKGVTAAPLGALPSRLVSTIPVELEDVNLPGVGNLYDYIVQQEEQNAGLGGMGLGQLPGELPNFNDIARISTGGKL